MVTVASEYRHMLDRLLKIEEQSSQWYQVSPSPLVQDVKNVLDPSQRWRHKICDWYYEFIDHYNFDREVVGIAISYFDRFISTNANSFDDKHAMDIYQRVAVTSLFLALKLHATSCEVENLLEARSRALSKILYSTPNPQDILEMELKMLRSFEWHVNPPTMHQFAFLFFKLHPLHDIICSAAGNYLYESTRYQVELAVYVPELFVRFKPSVVVCAAMKNAEEYIAANNPCVKRYFEKLPTQYQEDALAVAQCQQLLKRLCPRLPDLDYFSDDDAIVAAPGNDSLRMTRTRNESNSPTTVADF